MAADRPFVSYAPHAEDVLLWRALGHLPSGRYVEIWTERPGARAAEALVTALHRRGWRGLLVAPSTQESAQESIQESTQESAPESRPADGVGTEDRPASIAVVGLEADPARLAAVLEEHLPSTEDVHVLVLHTPNPAAVLPGLDLRRRRPWVLVVESVPVGGDGDSDVAGHTVLRDNGYRCAVVHGGCAFYVAEEHAATLRPALAVPPQADDDFVPLAQYELEEQLAAARAELDRMRAEHDHAVEELIRWRGTVLARWTAALDAGGGGGRDRRPGHEVVALREELAATQATLSWRITAPLRAVQRLRLQGWR